MTLDGWPPAKACHSMILYPPNTAQLASTICDTLLPHMKPCNRTTVSCCYTSNLLLVNLPPISSLSSSPSTPPPPPPSPLFSPLSLSFLNITHSPRQHMSGCCTGRVGTLNRGVDVKDAIYGHHGSHTPPHPHPHISMSSYTHPHTHIHTHPYSPPLYSPHNTHIYTYIHTCSTPGEKVTVGLQTMINAVVTCHL